MAARLSGPEKQELAAMGRSYAASTVDLLAPREHRHGPRSPACDDRHVFQADALRKCLSGKSMGASMAIARPIPRPPAAGR